jgi:hypothetical protein
MEKYIVNIQTEEGVLWGVFTDEDLMIETVKKHLGKGECKSTMVPRLNELFIVRKK